MDTNRRAFLAGVATAATGLSLGCLQRTDGGATPEAESPTSATPQSGSPGGDTTPAEDSGGVVVRTVAARPELVTRDSPDSYGVYGDRDSQYVVATIDVTNPADRQASSFLVAAGGKAYSGTTEIGPSRGWLAEFGDDYDAKRGDGRGTGWVAVRVPKPLDPDARLTWDGGQHGLRGGTLDRLVRPPTEFAVEFEAPDTVQYGGTVVATLTVENVGSTDGLFVAALNRAGPRVAYAPEENVAVEVPAGDSTGWTYEFPVADPEIRDMDDPSMRLYPVWRGGSPSHEVRIDLG